MRYKVESRRGRRSRKKKKEGRLMKKKEKTQEKKQKQSKKRVHGATGGFQVTNNWGCGLRHF